jgi:hypothetical protein
MFRGFLVIGGDAVLRIETALESFRYPGIVRAALPVALIQLHGLTHDFPGVLTLTKCRNREKNGPQQNLPHVYIDGRAGRKLQ